jgi:hypothetical protein
LNDTRVGFPTVATKAERLQQRRQGIIGHKYHGAYSVDCSVQCIAYSVGCSVQCIAYSVDCSVQCIAYSVECSVQCIAYFVE